MNNLKRSSRNIWTIIATGILIVALMGSFGCSSRKEEKAPEQKEWKNLMFVNGLTQYWVQIDADTSKCGYINPEGTFVFLPQFEAGSRFSDNGLAAVLVDGMWGYINTEGKYVVAPKFRFAMDFADNGLAAVCIDEKWGYIDTKGKYVITPQFDFANGFSSNGLAAVCVGEKWGYINSKGEHAIAFKYEDALSFSNNGLAAVKKAGNSVTSMKKANT